MADQFRVLVESSTPDIVTVRGHGSTGAVVEVGDAAAVAHRLMLQQWSRLAAILRSMDVPVAYLRTLYVEREQRHGGVGSSLVRATMEESRLRGARSIWVHAGPHDGRTEDLVAWYARLGFRRHDRSDGAYPILWADFEGSAPRVGPTGQLEIPGIGYGSAKETTR